MLTDRVPRKASLLAEYHESDQNQTLEVPRDSRLKTVAKVLESSLKGGTIAEVRQSCAEFLKVASDFYTVQAPPVRVLAACPLRSYEGGWSSELFGDYNPESRVIRIWMRTAVRKQVTSYGTFLSTLCHEFCHHLDYQRFKYSDSWHTRGFYGRAAWLYHHARGTPAKRLFWIKVPGGRWRIDWPRTNRGF